MSQENVEIVRRVIDARNRGDRDAAFAYAAPDIEFDFSTSTGPWAGIYRGVEATMRLWDGMDEAFSEFRWEPQEFIDAGDAVVVTMRFHIRGRGSGVETVVRGAQVYWLKDGTVVRYRHCQNRADALEAAGLRA
jgi:ketosteroid isomerase-like protein